MLMISFLQFLLFQLMVQGAFGQDWIVKYPRTVICALKGSTVLMYSDYKHPSNIKGVKTFWTKNPNKKNATDLREDPEYSGRIRYFDDQKNLAFLKLENVTKRDEHMYCLRITSDSRTERFLGYPGLRLRVTDLRVDVSEHVLEGNMTLLTCRTTCNLTNAAAFLWYKNRRLIKTTEGRNILSLQLTRTEDAGSYSCAVNGPEHLSSFAVTVMARYPPKNVLVSVSPSGEIVEGSSVTLTCSSDANPPVQSYTWFKNRTLVGKGQTLTISNFSSEDAGEYKCKCSNAEGQRYSVGESLNVVDGQKKVHEIVIGVIVICAVLSSAVIFFLRKKKKCCWSDGHMLKEDNIYSNTTVETPSNDANASPVNPDDHQYDSVVHQSVVSSTCDAAEEVHYATVQRGHDKGVEKVREGDVQYASVVFNHSHRCPAMKEDRSVIYSTLK